MDVHRLPDTGVRLGRAGDGIGFFAAYLPSGKVEKYHLTGAVAVVRAALVVGRGMAVEIHLWHGEPARIKAGVYGGQAGRNPRHHAAARAKEFACRDFGVHDARQKIAECGAAALRNQARQALQARAIAAGDPWP